MYLLLLEETVFLTSMTLICQKLQHVFFKDRVGSDPIFIKCGLEIDRVLSFYQRILQLLSVCYIKAPFGMPYYKLVPGEILKIFFPQIWKPLFLLPVIAKRCTRTRLTMLTIGNLKKVVAVAKALHKDIRTWGIESEVIGTDPMFYNQNLF